MNRLALRFRGSQLRALPISTRAVTSFPIRQYASSAPKEAEGPSAHSGGSRSKDAAEKHDQVEGEKHNQVDGGSNPAKDPLAGPGALGRTGGGEPLSSSSYPPAPPKVANSSVPGQGKKLSKEQQEEVDQHNKDFEQKHDKASAAAEDKVDKGFWKGHGGVQGG